MKIKLELFGASRDFSAKNYLEFNINGQLEIKDFRKEIINYLNKNFKGNEDFIKIVKTSAFCSEDNQIINDNFKIIKDQKIGIIPPIGGG
ncbi:molybdopterin biosynthesis protein MoeD [Candidatus Pelagibacter sp. Uisw_134_02]|uniref:molybdopterin biosynthesis protein MoeD n=1 Tax=Candidatus Pelagibacter sp. Uisw_134_02 TaxID=3230990 RepID=UPI0039EC6609